jgi:glycosyltransferase involved in cell wall biosynthesis
MKPKNEIIVSVCMITYNHEQYIAQAIEGVLFQQCNFAFELIIGEDFSIDNTYKICEEYANNNSLIKLLPSIQNHGMMPNFIRSLNSCSGKYIALCEGDDYWTDPLKLQKQVDFMEANAEYGLVHTDHDIYYEEKCRFLRNSQKAKRQNRSGYIFHDLLISNLIGTLTVMIRRDILLPITDDIRLNVNWLMGDYPLWLYISSKHQIGYIPFSTAVYRERINSVRQTSNINFSLLFFESTHEIRLHFMKNVTIPEKIKRKIDSDYNKGLLRYAYLLKDKELAKKSMKYLVKNNLYHIGILDIANYLSSYKRLWHLRMSIEKSISSILSK